MELWKYGNITRNKINKQKETLTNNVDEQSNVTNYLDEKIVFQYYCICICLMLSI